MKMLCRLILALCLPLAAVAGETIVQDAEGAQLVRFEIAKDSVKITYARDGQQQVLTRQGRDYALANGEKLARVKDKGQSFKVYAGDELIWKVKLYDDKVKISDNEENKDPHQVKQRDGGTHKVEGPTGDEVGRVRLRDDGVHVYNAMGDLQARVPGTKTASAALGVLLMPGIAGPETYILMAELMRRGR